MKDWEFSELDAADNYGKKVPGSGNGNFDKLDIAGEEEFSKFRIENRYTTKKSYSLKLDDLKISEKQAITLHNQTHVRRVDFGNGDVFIIIRENVFKNNFLDESPV